MSLYERLKNLYDYLYKNAPKYLPSQDPYALFMSRIHVMYMSIEDLCYCLKIASVLFTKNRNMFEKVESEFIDIAKKIEKICCKELGYCPGTDLDKS